MSATTVDLAPPEINFGGVPVGFDLPVLFWGFGEVQAPDNLTGRAAQVLLWPGTAKQTVLTPIVNGAQGTVTLAPPALTDVTPYLLLLADTPGGSLIPRVRGTITPGVRRRT